jgi:hypothetical protein
MAGIVATLEAHDALCALGQPVNQLALAFITPLGSHDNDVASFACIHLVFSNLEWLN